MSKNLFESNKKRKLPLWLPPKDDPAPQVVMSSEVSVARNLAGLNFPPFHNKWEDAREAEQKLLKALANISPFSHMTAHPISDFNFEEKYTLCQRGICSKAFLSSAQYRSLMFSNDETVTTRINGHNHLEIVLRKQGNHLGELVKQAQTLIAKLDAQMDFAKDDDLGYICTDLDLLGSGLRMRQLLHLPALELKKFTEMAGSAAKEFNFKLVCTTPQDLPNAMIFRVETKNAVSTNPMVCAARMEDFVSRLEKHELDTRRMILDGDNKGIILDFIGRSQGIVRHAYRVSYPESRHLLSALWLGAETGHLPESTRTTVFEILGDVDGIWQLINGLNSSDKRRELRAMVLKNVLQNCFTD